MMHEDSDADDENPAFAPSERVGVLLPVPFTRFGQDPLYDYRVPEGLILHAGDFVRAPLGPRKLAGVVWGPGQGKVEDAKLKDVYEKLPVPPMDPRQRRFLEWVAAYTLSALGAVLKMAMGVPGALEPPGGVKTYRLADPLPVMKMTKARRNVLHALRGGTDLTAGEAARAAQCTTAVVAGLRKAGALVETARVHEHIWPIPDAHHPGAKLSHAQAAAAAHLVDSVRRGGYRTLVLDGVPGSGKTEVYFEAVAEALRCTKQVLVLLPEIALSTQWLTRFTARFGAKPAAWHSDLGARARRETWRGVATGRVRVVVGARSALFLPFHDLGLIVVDEEHDPAFKQEEGVIYHARDMAVVRAHLDGFPICLASATPSLETHVNAQNGKYDFLHLPERHGGALLPEMKLIDMRREKLPATRWLSETLKTALHETFAAKEQAMLFLNRRGYAPLSLCRACGFRLACPNCAAWLVEHRAQRHLQCHHCGHTQRLPESCPHCAGEHTFAACGPGVERLAEEVQNVFPDIRFALASSDTLSTMRAASEVIRRIEDHDVDLIIGTQIVAKGYHFPLLTLVGVVDGDLGLAGGDLRAAERTYQLLYQVAGRAGRSAHPGRVMVQTYQPDHAVMRAMETGRRDVFIAEEIRARTAMDMPPFGRLVALIVSGVKESAVDAQAQTLSRTAPHIKGVSVLGPAPAPIAFLRARHRRRLLMKVAPGLAAQPIVRDWLKRTHREKGVRLQVDVDPQSFL